MNDKPPDILFQLIENFKKIEPRLLEYLRSQTWRGKTVSSPLCLWNDSVIDNAIYDVKADKITEVWVNINSGGETKCYNLMDYIDD
jgi:hypothetical protein